MSGLKGMDSMKQQQSGRLWDTTVATEARRLQEYFMTNENFDLMRKKVLRDHRHSIVRSGLRGLKEKGRGLVMVKYTQKGKSGMVHISYLPLDALKLLQLYAGPENADYGLMIIEKVSEYSPGSQIPVMVTDGESEHFSFGMRQAA
jgi:hypothetical protein